jgi:hypothetical protein
VVINQCLAGKVQNFFRRPLVCNIQNLWERSAAPKSAQFVSCLRCGLNGWIVGAEHKRDCPLCERSHGSVKEVDHG